MVFNDIDPQGDFIMSTNFKTSIFGGFDREDVISYIEKTAHETKAQIDELTESRDALAREKEFLVREIAELRERASQFTSVSDALESLRTEAEELSRRVEQLTAENETLRGQANEYLSLRDHIADIEISAHRRTEEFRAKAIARLHQLVADQQGWCAERRNQYAAAHESVVRQIQTTLENLGEPDLSGFDQMEEQLRELADSLDN
jgi:chromosome segregation ATPase